MSEFINAEKLKNFVNEIIDERMNEGLNQSFKKAEKKNKLYTRNELKNLFKTTHPTIDRWCERGLLRKIYVGSRVYFDGEQVEELLRGNIL